MARRILHWYRLEPPSLPMRHWLPQYERRWLRPDLVAAAAVWAVLVPEGVAARQAQQMKMQLASSATLLGLLP